MNMVNYIIWHRQFGGTGSIQDPASEEAQEVDSPLSISSWKERQCSNGPWSHTIGMFFVGLDIFSKLIFAVSVVIDLQACYDFSWADGVRHAIGVWEGVQPKYSWFRHFQYEVWGHMGEGKSVVDCSNSFLNHTDVALNFPDVFIT